MSVTFQLPSEIERTLRLEFDNLDQAAKEAALVELYRLHKLTHFQLSQSLGLSRYQTDTLLKQHGVTYDVTLDDVARESESLRPTGKE